MSKGQQMNLFSRLTIYVYTKRIYSSESCSPANLQKPFLKIKTRIRLCCSFRNTTYHEKILHQPWPLNRTIMPLISQIKYLKTSLVIHCHQKTRTNLPLGSAAYQILTQLLNNNSRLGRHRQSEDSISPSNQLKRTIS